MNFRSVWQKARVNKRGWIIGVTLFCLILGGYAFVSVRYWQDYDHRAEEKYQQIKDKTKKALALSAASQEEKNKKLIAFEEITHSITRYDSSCTVDWLFSWQQQLPVSKIKVEKCKKIAERLMRFSGLLVRTVEYIKAEKMLSTILTEASKTGMSVADSDMQQLLQQWTNAVKTIEGQTGPSDFKKTKESALQSARSVQMAWQGLIEAGTSKDRTKYEQAIIRLATTYDALGQIAQTSQQQLEVILAELDRSFEAAFQKP